MDLKELKAVAEREMSKHGLHDWSFGFADTRRRLGVCKFQTKRIEIAEYYAIHSAAETVLDTLLHEIAHALVGRRHNHDAVWQAKARAIGCTAERCHRVEFTPHPLVARCINGCFAIGRHRRRCNMRCRRCGGAVRYDLAAG